MTADEKRKMFRNMFIFLGLLFLLIFGLASDFRTASINAIDIALLLIAGLVIYKVKR